MLRAPSFAENDVVSIKMSNGEEIICRYISEMNDVLVVDRPVALQLGPKGQPALMPYFMTVAPDNTRNINLNKNLVVMIGKTDKPLADQYTSAMTGITLAPAGLKL